jgi:chromate transporter
MVRIGAGPVSRVAARGDTTVDAAGDPIGRVVPDVSLSAIAGAFAKIGLMSFGGALSGWMHRELVLRRQWLDEEDFLSGLALGQIMPGANVANLSLYIGYRLRGSAGAIVALLGMLLPPMALVLLLAMLYERSVGAPWLHRFVGGVAAAAIGLTITVGVRACRRVERRAGPLAVLLAIFVTVGVMGWPMVPVVLCGAPLSIALAWPRRGAPDA